MARIEALILVAGKIPKEILLYLLFSSLKIQIQKLEKSGNRKEIELLNFVTGMKLILWKNIHLCSALNSNRLTSYLLHIISPLFWLLDHIVKGLTLLSFILQSIYLL